MPKDPRFVYTDVGATELEEQQMANPPEPLQMMGYSTPTQAQIMHACALANGLPDIHGFYGYDFAEHEFIRLPQSKEKEPEPEPRTLEDIMRDGDEDEFRELVDAELDAALREGFEE